MTAARRRSAGLPDVLPVLPLRSTVVYPMGVVGVQIDTPASLEVLASHPGPNLVVAVVVAPGGPDEPIDPRELRKVAVAARVSDRLNLPGGIVQATLQGLQRVRLTAVQERDGHLIAEYSMARERPAGESSARILITRILSALEALSGQVERIPREVPRILRMNLADPGRFADLVATLANFSMGSKDRVLQQLSVSRRLSFIRDQLEAQVQRVRQMADAPAPDSPDEGGERARELRRQIQILQAELGDVDPVEAEAVALLRNVETAGLPARAAMRARAEIERLRGTTGTTDVAETRDYVDWLLAMPWHQSATDGLAAIDLERVQAELDRELLGLAEPKERLLDHLAVARLRGMLSGPIPCIVGPPDVGKTALARALARGLGRPLVRLDLAGRGETDLLGQRRARGGGQPGRIASLLRDARVNDAVMLLDEVDELVPDKTNGDPGRSLEDLLTGERKEFTDRYLDVPFALDNLLFVAVAQDFHRIPRGLRELMVEIRIAGYTPEEKVDIARRRLIPRLIERHGLKRGHVSFPVRGLAALAYGYARDAGVGTMRRSIETLLRTRARARAGGDTSRWVFDAARIEGVLGTPRYIVTPAESTPEIGVVTGLAWTAAGGELMFIEALRMPGTGRLIITGMLGDVMRESVNAAYSYVRSRGPELGITEDDFRDSDVHVHFPVGAIPKDGPSAGIAVTLAIASTLSDRPIRHDIAMTGEVTLRGKVLEVGGIKEKVLAAHRADIRRVILPEGNARDLRDVPEKVRESIEFHFVDRMDDVVRIALHGTDFDTPVPVRLAPQASTQPHAARSGRRPPTT